MSDKDSEVSEEMMSQDLSSLLANSETTTKQSIETIFQIFSTNCPLKTCPTTTQSISVLRQQLQSPIAQQSEETLLKLTKILIIYTKIASEGAIVAGKLLGKLLRNSAPTLQMLELICDEMVVPLQKNQYQKVAYYSTIMQLLMGKLTLPREFFVEKIKPLISLMNDNEKGREHVVSIGKVIPFDFLAQDFFWVALRRVGFLRLIFISGLRVDRERFGEICERLSELDAQEFDEFVEVLFEFLLGWEENGNFELLGLILDLLDVVMRISNEEIKEELKSCLKSIDSWHVQILVCWDLFGEPKELREKSDSSLPLELYINHKNNESPSEELIERVYSLKDELTYKFCLLALGDVVNFELELEQITEKLVELISQHGRKILPRVRHVLSHELQ